MSFELINIQNLTLLRSIGIKSIKLYKEIQIKIKKINLTKLQMSY